MKSMTMSLLFILMSGMGYASEWTRGSSCPVFPTGSEECFSLSRQGEGGSVSFMCFENGMKFFHLGISGMLSIVYFPDSINLEWGKLDPSLFLLNHAKRGMKEITLEVNFGSNSPLLTSIPIDGIEREYGEFLDRCAGWIGAVEE